jgi:hypothetical protein
VATYTVAARSARNALNTDNLLLVSHQVGAITLAFVNHYTLSSLHCIPSFRTR